MLQLPKVIGHRGAAAYAPENTLASFREARRRGATWVETDVKLTADGVPIVMHDDSLKRTTGIDRLVAETPRAELPTERADLRGGDRLLRRAGAGLQCRDQALTEGREAETARVVVETLRRCWPAHLPPPLLSSFKDASLAAAHAAAPEFARALLIGRAGRGLAASAPRRWRRRASIPTARGSRRRARRARSRRAGYALGVYTIDDGDVAGPWSAWGWTASSPTRPM